MATWILGVSAFYHGSAAALVRDGQIIGAAQEERFSRQKADASFPTRAIRYCLEKGAIARLSWIMSSFMRSRYRSLSVSWRHTWHSHPWGSIPSARPSRSGQNTNSASLRKSHCGWVHFATNPAL